MDNRYAVATIDIRIKRMLTGLIEDGTEDLRVELCPQNKRGDAELLPIILKHVRKGTTIRTDFWKGYASLEENGYIHERVNHSARENPFVSEEGVHTQRIEASWRPVKDYFRKIQIRSVCIACQGLLNANEAKWRAAPNNEEEAKKKMRAESKKIRAAMASCAGCISHQEKFAEKLIEYQWRRDIAKNNSDPFEKLLEAIKKVYPCE